MLPFRSSSIHAVVALSLLELVPGWDKMVSEAQRVLSVIGVFVIQLPNLMYLVEPHTKFPLLGFLPKRIRSVITSSVNYGELQFSCTLKNVVRKLEEHNFKT